jgi:hypothetical protein
MERSCIGHQQGEADGRRLPANLVANLSPRTQSALEHPLRRQILRLLNASGSPRSPIEIATEISASVSVVGYHAGVLRDCGSVEVTAGWPDGDAAAPSYSSTVAADPQIASVLQATSHLDRSGR